MCNGHAADCQYNSARMLAECINCTDNTSGDSCDNCLPGFYPNMTTLLNDPNICIGEYVIYRECHQDNYICSIITTCLQMKCCKVIDFMMPSSASKHHSSHGSILDVATFSCLRLVHTSYLSMLKMSRNQQ